MAIETISFNNRFPEQAPLSFMDLFQGKTTALVVTDAPHDIWVDTENRWSARLPWLKNMGSLQSDRSTELAGTMHFPDMPAHIDPHGPESLKACVITEGLAIARFLPNVQVEFLDEHNELPDNDYTNLVRHGFEPEQTLLGPGDAALFYGSTTLHEFESLGVRATLVNSYQAMD